jgi:hypothetical protein
MVSITVRYNALEILQRTGQTAFVTKTLDSQKVYKVFIYAKSCVVKKECHNWRWREQHPRAHLHRAATLLLQGEGLPQGDQQRQEDLRQDEVPGIIKQFTMKQNIPVTF